MIFICARSENKTDYSVRGAAGAIRPDTDNWFDDVVVYLLGTIHLVLSLWMLVEYFVVNWPNFVLPRYVYWIL